MTPEAEVIANHRLDPYMRICVDARGLPGCLWHAPRRGSDPMSRAHNEHVADEIRALTPTPKEQA